MLRTLLVFLVLVTLASVCPAGPLSVRIQQPVTYRLEAGGLETLQDVLDQLATRYELKFDVNETAFRAEGINYPGRQRVGDDRIPPIGGVSVPFADLLRKVLSRVKNRSGATFLLREDHIEITTNKAARDEVWGPEASGRFLPLVHVDFDNTALPDAIELLRQSSGYNIPLAPAVLKRPATFITLKLRNTPLDVALGTIADMMELRLDQRANVFHLKLR